MALWRGALGAFVDFIVFFVVCAAVVVAIALFFSNNRLGERLDRIESETKILGSNFKQIELLYAALLASRQAPGTAPEPTPPAAAPAAPPPMPAAAPEVPVIATPPGPPETRASAHAPEPPPAPAASVPLTAPKPPRRFEWERFIGVNLPIWLGAIALCIAGYFFVSYAIESGFFTPEFRVLAALAAGLGFLAAAEFVRRRATTDNTSAIAAALASAAIATLYATAYIASVTYALIPQFVGFAAMAAVTALAIVIALAFGQVVAVVGLLGGYLTPALFASEAPSALTLFGYLTALHVAMFGVIRLKSWWQLTLPALLGPAVWIVLWSQVFGFEAQPIIASVFLILVPVVVGMAASRAWLDSEESSWLVGGQPGWARRALPLSVGLASLGFLAFLSASGFAIVFWQGLIIFGILTVAVGFLWPLSLSYLQFLPLAASVLALLTWRATGYVEVAFITGALSAIFGFGALDQFRRLRRPVAWASALAFVALFFFAIALFKVSGWQSVLEQKHLWALAALALAAAFTGLLWVFGPRVEPAEERSRVYAALAGAVTTFISLTAVIELDPVLFPASAAVAVVGLAAVHGRVPVRRLRVLAAIYAVVYGLLAVGAGAAITSSGSPLAFVLAKSLEEAPLVLLILPGLAFFGAATLFQRSPAAGQSKPLVDCLDAASILMLALGIFYLVTPNIAGRLLADAYVTGAKLANPELVLAAVAVFAGHVLARRALYIAGLLLALLVAVAMLLGLVAPVYSFWPAFDLPAVAIFSIALLTLGLPALIYLGIGRFLRGETNLALANIGRGLSVFAVFVLFTLILVEIRHAYHPERLQGPMTSAEFYSYSIGMLAFGVGLLLFGVALQNRGARALSFVFVLAATVKVFLFDAASLEGLWRVLSFLGMGLSFLGISWAYARYVFGLGRGKPAAPAPA